VPGCRRAQRHQRGGSISPKSIFEMNMLRPMLSLLPATLIGQPPELINPKMSLNWGV
jgi:hypothetical protein